MSARYRMSVEGTRFLAAWEGLRTEVYLDVAGYPTIGVGHLIVDGEDFSKGITERQALELLSEDLKVYEEAVSRNVLVNLQVHESDALISWTFNLGEPNLRRSTMLKRINEGLFESAAAELLRWNKAGGVVVNGLARRRKAEYELFLNGIYTTP